MCLKNIYELNTLINHNKKFNYSNKPHTWQICPDKQTWPDGIVFPMTALKTLCVKLCINEKPSINMYKRFKKLTILY